MSDFTTANLKTVLTVITDPSLDYPQEVLTTDLKRTIAKTIGKIHPLALTSFTKGMADMGVISVKGTITVVLMGADDL